MSETKTLPAVDDYESDFGDESDGEDRHCWRCHGEGWGMVGVAWDVEDGVNGPYDDEIEECRRCNGSGLEKDAWYW